MAEPPPTERLPSVGHNRALAAARKRGEGGSAPSPRTSGGLWLAVLLGVLGGFGAAGALKWRELTRDLPDVERLAAHSPAEVTEVVDRHGTLLAELYEERRYVVPLEAVPQRVRDAFVAAEDADFYEHDGIDLRGIARAFGANVSAGRSAQGGSTITQQVARGILLANREKSWKRKVREAVLARRISARFSKDEVLALYLNEVFLGAQSYGVEGAARTYFGKSVGALSLAEGAMLAGLTQRPAEVNPFVDLAASERRQAYVLERMAAEGMLSAAEAEAAMAEPLMLAQPGAPRVKAVPGYVEHVRRELVATYGPAVAARGGLRVVVAVDLAFQAKAQAAVAAQAAKLDREREAAAARRKRPAPAPVQGAFVAVELVSGGLLALVGGVGDSDSFNRATQARRQVGSTFKPVVYLAGIEERELTVADVFDDSPIAVRLPTGGTWSPENFGGQQAGAMTVARGLASSNNRVLVRALLRLDPAMKEERVYRFARRLGLGGPRIATEERPPADEPQHLCPTESGKRACGYALGLGAADLSLYELVRAYTVVGTGGLLLEPRAILEVRDRGGALLRAPGAEPVRVLEPGVAAIGNWLLRGVVESGTARAAARFREPVVGKTGTSDESRDVWFVGLTPGVAAGAWLGVDTPEPITPRATGGNSALPVWLVAMEAAPAGRKTFPAPPANALAWTPAGEPLLPGTAPRGAAPPEVPWWLGPPPELRLPE